MSGTTTALVTGGAGLIGSHIVDAALAQGWNVRILDNLERQTHRNGKPAWLAPEAEFMRGDVRHRGDWERALEGVDIVFHEAAYGGYMPEIAKFIHVNAVGTAIMLETIRDRNLPVRKVVIASSQAVYNEGAYACPTHGHFFGTTRPIAQLQAADYDVHCPICGVASAPVPTNERAPMGGENVYAISKADQERLTRIAGDDPLGASVAVRHALAGHVVAFGDAFANLRGPFLEALAEALAGLASPWHRAAALPALRLALPLLVRHRADSLGSCGGAEGSSTP